MRRISISILFVLITPSLVAGQLVHSGKLDQDPTRGIFNQFVAASDCLLPALSLMTEVVTSVKQGDKLVFCTNTDTVRAEGLLYTIAVDLDPIKIPLLVKCSQNFISVICASYLPDSIIPTLQVKAPHKLTISTVDLTPLAGGIPNVIADIIVNVRRPVCIDEGITYEVGAPLPASVTGALRNQQGTFTFETQVGKLRSEGFHVEWQRVQFGLDSTGLNGYWYLLGWCDGK